MSQPMSVALVALVDSVETWSPERDAPNESFEYIDLSAIDQDVKAIIGAREVPCAEAPSRAKQIVAAGDVLVSTVRPNLNGVARVPSEMHGATASTGFCVLRPRREKLDSAYLLHWVRSPRFIAEMVRRATGASYPAVSDRIVLESNLPLPPLPEQRRIAEVLDRAEVLRAKRRAALGQLDTLTHAIFLDMFGDPAINGKGWDIRTLESVAHKITDGTHKTPTYEESGVIFLSAKDLKNGGIDWSTGKFISGREHLDLTKRCDPELGDILLAKSGSLGTVAIVDCNRDFSLFESLCLIKHRREVVEGSFLIHMLRSPTMLVRLLDKNKGIAIKHLHLVDIRGLSVPLPPIELQREFSRRVRTVEKIRTAQRASLAGLGALFATLQHRAFRGEL